MSVTAFADQPRTAPDLSSLLDDMGVTKDSVIQVTGPDSLGALLWLCRRGFEHAAYVKCGAPRPHERADALIAPHVSSREDLIRMLDTAPRVRPGGALLVQTRAEANGPDDDLGAVLARFGYRMTARYRRGARDVVAARRLPSVYAAAA